MVNDKNTGITGAAGFVGSTLGNTVGSVSRTVGNVAGAATRGVGDTVTAATGQYGKAGLFDFGSGASPSMSLTGQHSLSEMLLARSGLECKTGQTDWERGSRMSVRARIPGEDCREHVWRIRRDGLPGGNPIASDGWPKGQIVA
jgi:hypothetical protein